MDVRGRWRKKTKDIVPNKKADEGFEVCGSASTRPMLWAANISFPGSLVLIPS